MNADLFVWAQKKAPSSKAPKSKKPDSDSDDFEDFEDYDVSRCVTVFRTCCRNNFLEGSRIPFL